MPPSPPHKTDQQRNHQQQNNNGGAGMSAMLNSLVHFLQQNKGFSSCSTASDAMPTACIGPPQHPTVLVDSDCAKNGPALIKCNNGTAPNQQQQTNGIDTTAALFAKTVDSLNNFLSPNVLLLPVAFHSLADEQHIQLLGMPQTVIPIAIHRAMQKQFAVRPLLVDETMAFGGNSGCGAGKGIDTLPKHIGIGRAVAAARINDCCCCGGRTALLQQSQQLLTVEAEDHPFQLPVALRSSPLVHPTQNYQHQQKEEKEENQCQCQQNNNHLPNNNNNHLFNNNSHLLLSPVALECTCNAMKGSPAIANFGVDEQGKVTEPLDLSLASQTKTNGIEKVGSSGGASAVGIQRKKRTPYRGGPTEGMGEVGKKMGKMTSDSAAGHGEKQRTSPVVGGLSAVGPSPLLAPPSSSSCSSSALCPFFPPLVLPSLPSSSTHVIGPNPSSKDVSLSTSCPVVTLPADSASRKRFLCDLCGDVSFLAMETLVGHKKYYCRNRSRPAADDPKESSKSANSSTVTVMNKEDPNSATASVSHGLKGSNSSSCSSSPSSPPAASPPVVQCPHCPFQTVNSVLLCQHQKQRHSPLPVVCAECGYRAFTTRGLRTHARHSHHYSATGAAVQQITANKKALANAINGANNSELKTTPKRGDNESL